MTKPRRMTRHRAESGYGPHYADLDASDRIDVRVLIHLHGVVAGTCDKCDVRQRCGDACRFCRIGRGEPYPDVPLWSRAQTFPAPFPKDRGNTVSTPRERG